MTLADAAALSDRSNLNPVLWWDARDFGVRRDNTTSARSDTTGGLKNQRQFSSTAESSKDKENHAIRWENTVKSPLPSLKSSLIKRRPVQSNNSRQINFLPTVTIFNLDTEGKYVSTCCEKLREERPSTTNRSPTTMPPQLSPAFPRTKPLTLFSRDDDVSRGQDRITSHMNGAARFHEKVRPILGDFNITLINVGEARKETTLKMTVFIGQGYTADDILVKAGIQGCQVRVMATRYDGKKIVQQFNEKYILPRSVDPYSIDARLDGDGTLVVEAPLLTTTARPQKVFNG